MNIPESLRGNQIPTFTALAIMKEVKGDKEVFLSNNVHDMKTEFEKHVISKGFDRPDDTLYRRLPDWKWHQDCTPRVPSYVPEGEYTRRQVKIRIGDYSEEISRGWKP